MDTVESYRPIIESILTDLSKIPYAYGRIEQQAIFDRKGDHYLLMNVGWDNDRRVHGCLVHVDIVDDKIHIQRDGTEDGIATRLLEAGVPRDRIALAFKHPSLQPHTGFALA